MQINFSPKQSGKTTELIQWASKFNACIICFSQNEAQRVFKQSQDMGLSIRFPLTASESLQGLKPLLLSIDIIFQALSRYPLWKKEGKNEIYKETSDN